MKAFWTGILLASSTLSAGPLSAQSIYCNRYGACSGTTSNGQYVNTYTNRYGGTSGTIGGQNVNLYTNRYGGTTGTVGGRSVSCSTSYGVTRCN